MKYFVEKTPQIGEPRWNKWSKKLYCIVGGRMFMATDNLDYVDDGKPIPIQLEKCLDELTEFFGKINQ